MRHMGVRMNLACLSTVSIHVAGLASQACSVVLGGQPAPPLISEQSQPQLENTGTWRDNSLFNWIVLQSEANWQRIEATWSRGA